MKLSNSTNTFQTSGQLVVSPVRRRQNTSTIQLRRYVPRPEDSQQVRECFFEKECRPDFRFKIPNPRFIKEKKWVTHSKHIDKKVMTQSEKKGAINTLPRYAPNPHDSTQLNNLMKNITHPNTPNFDYNRNATNHTALSQYQEVVQASDNYINNDNTNNSSSNKNNYFNNNSINNDNRNYIDDYNNVNNNNSSISYDNNNKVFTKTDLRNIKHNKKNDEKDFNEKPLVETILTFRNKWRKKSTHNFSVFSDPSSQYTRTYRVGEHSGVMNNTRPDLALRGVLRSNLPTMEGVLGLGDLNQTTWRALGGVPHERHKVHASAKLHPTYRTIQVEKMFGQEHSDEVLDSLRKRGNAHSPVRQFVRQGQGTADEINWVQQTRNSRLKMENRKRYLNSKIFVENRDKPSRKEVENLNMSGVYNNTQ